MELRQIRYFLAVVDAGSISEGARRLHISQPPLSVTMRALEEELGAKLFQRGHNHLTLTDAGRAFYQKGQNMIDLALQTQREIKEMGSGRTLHLGVTPTTVSLVMPAIGMLKGSNPLLHIDLHDGSTYQLLDLMAQRIIEAAVIRTPCSVGTLSTLSLARDRMMFLGKDARGKDCVSLEEIAKRPLILYRRYRDFITEAFTRHNLEVNLVGECDDARTAMAMVGEGIGNAIIPATMRLEAETLYFAFIDSEDLSTEILFVWNQESPLVDAIKKCLLRIQESPPEKKGGPVIQSK